MYKELLQIYFKKTSQEKTGKEHEKAKRKKEI